MSTIERIVLGVVTGGALGLVHGWAIDTWMGGGFMSGGLFILLHALIGAVGGLLVLAGEMAMRSVVPTRAWRALISGLVVTVICTAGLMDDMARRSTLAYLPSLLWVGISSCGLVLAFGAQPPPRAENREGTQKDRS